MLPYDGRRPEPPYTTPAEDALAEAIDLLRSVATEYRRMRLAFAEGDSRRVRCEELSDEVLVFIGEHE